MAPDLSLQFAQQAGIQWTNIADDAKIVPLFVLEFHPKCDASFNMQPPRYKR